MSFGEVKWEGKRELTLEEELEDGKRIKLEDDGSFGGDQGATIVLNTGAKMPVLQFGTYKLKGDESYHAVLSALRQGYRGLDTATCYDNEKQVGAAIKASGVSRSNIFVQTKLWRSYAGRDPKTNKPRCDTWLKKSLKNLGIDRLDLWLMHWPGPGRHLNYPPVKMGMERPKEVKPENSDKMAPVDWTPSMRLETYRDMAAHCGPHRPVSALGVCNFSVRQLKELLNYCTQNNLPRPAVVQNECHPFLLASPVRSLCQKEGIVFQAYASLGAGSLGLLDEPCVRGIARDIGVTPAQVLLRWGLQKGCTLLPKSSKPERQKINMELWGFKLGKEEMDALDGLDRSVDGQNTMAGWLREHDPDFY